MEKLAGRKIFGVPVESPFDLFLATLRGLQF